MDFFLYEPEDFASNESYLRYYFRLNELDIAFWQEWISNHPEKLDCIINADQLISLLSLQLDESEFSQEHQRLLSAIANNITAETLPASDQLNVCKNESPPASVAKINLKKVMPVQRILIGAAVALISVSLCFYFSPLKNDVSLVDNNIKATKNFLQRINNSFGPRKYQLEDGSIVTLQPGSVLKYPRNFLPSKREVFLEGEAFFEVSKNKERPFYVYCQNLVAHVLGTSFNIKTDNIHGKVEVAVSTGKVEIYEKYNVVADDNKKGSGLILTPNQKAVYLQEGNKFECSLIDVPLPITYTEQDIKKDTGHLEMVYENPVPMSEILTLLGKEYGIDIEVENENLNKCHFSGNLTDLNLYLKLDAICQMVNASYEVKGTKILIRGNGCK